MDKYGFIILRHVNSKNTNKYWNLCVMLLRKWYPDTKIVVIDDNSNKDFLEPFANYTNVEIVESEFPGRGELLPYYYFLKTKYFNNAVIIHDSVFFHSRINFEKIIGIKVLPFWHFNADKENFLNNVEKSSWKNYEGVSITQEIADEILGFLYDSERYSIYLYLINPSTPPDAQRILLSLYSTIIEEKNDKIDYIIDNLNDELTSTFDRSKGKESLVISKRLKGPKGSTAPKGPKRPEGAKGETDLLKKVEFVKQRSNGDGNCFYNSIGMLSSDYLESKEKFDEYNSESIREKYKIQFIEQCRVRAQLSNFMRQIYEIIKDVDKESKIYKNSSVIKYIIKNSKNDFKYVRTERKSVSSKYFGGDEEIYFASLLYRQPIVTVIGVSDVTVFNIFYWQRYDIGGVDFNQYILQEDKTKIKIESVLRFIYESSQQISCSVDDISAFMLYYPNSYFLVGGRGHWSYAVNEKLIPGYSTSGDDSAGSSDTESVVSAVSLGGNNKYNTRFTKKVKNKCYRKSSAVKGTKKRKMTKKHMKSKEYKKGNKKTIKHT